MITLPAVASKPIPSAAAAQLPSGCASASHRWAVPCTAWAQQSERPPCSSFLLHNVTHTAKRTKADPNGGTTRFRKRWLHARTVPLDLSAQVSLPHKYGCSTAAQPVRLEHGTSRGEPVAKVFGMAMCCGYKYQRRQRRQKPQLHRRHHHHHHHHHHH